MGKIDDNKNNKLNKLLTTGFDLFINQGVSKTSISDITKAAGVAKGTFYLYFKDKYDLRNKLITYKATQIFQKAFDSSGYELEPQIEDKVIAIVDNVLDQLKNDRLLLTFIEKNLGWGLFEKTFASVEASQLKIIENMLIESGKKYSNVEIMTYTVFELVSSSCHNIILNHKPTTLEEYKPYLYKSIKAVMASFEI